MYLSNISNVINRRPNEYSAKQTPMNSLLEQWLRVRRPDAKPKARNCLSKRSRPESMGGARRWLAVRAKPPSGRTPWPILRQFANTARSQYRPFPFGSQRFNSFATCLAKWSVLAMDGEVIWTYNSPTLI